MGVCIGGLGGVDFFVMGVVFLLIPDSTQSIVFLVIPGSVVK